MRQDQAAAAPDRGRLRARHRARPRHRPPGLLFRRLLLGHRVPPPLGCDLYRSRNSQAPLGRPLHPTQLYEAFAEFAIFAFLYWRIGRPHRTGTIIGLYLILYSTARFIVEFFRAHEQGNLFNGPLDTSQWISLALIGLGAWLASRGADFGMPAPLQPALPAPINLLTRRKNSWADSGSGSLPSTAVAAFGETCTFSTKVPREATFTRREPRDR